MQCLPPHLHLRGSAPRTCASRQARLLRTFTGQRVSKNTRSNFHTKPLKQGVESRLKAAVAVQTLQPGSPWVLTLADWSFPAAAAYLAVWTLTVSLTTDPLVAARDALTSISHHFLCRHWLWAQGMGGIHLTPCLRLLRHCMLSYCLLHGTPARSVSFCQEA